jgi:hypothetical protein
MWDVSATEVKPLSLARGTLSLALRLLVRAYVHQPGQRRTAPNLPHRCCELRTLIDSASPHADRFGPGAAE